MRNISLLSAIAVAFALMLAGFWLSPVQGDDLGNLFKKTESGKSKSESKPAPSKSEERTPPKSDENENNLFRRRGNAAPTPTPTRQPSTVATPTANRPQPTSRPQPPVGPGEYWVYPPEIETPFGNRPRPSRGDEMINLARRTGEWQPRIYFPPINDPYRRSYPRSTTYGFYVRLYEPYRVCPSVYVYYYSMPAYISTERIVVVERPVFIEVPVFVYRDSYYLERNLPSRLDATIGDIQRAWRYNSPDLIRRHLRFDSFVAVYLQGKYAYSIPAEDYFLMTLDAMRNIRTVRFAFDEIRRRTNDIYVLYGQHVYEDEDRQLRTTYISYTVERMGNEWIITEVGSSPTPITRL